MTPFHALPPNGCRWPLNNAADASGHLFCGSPVAAWGLPYCPAHMSVGWKAGPNKAAQMRRRLALIKVAAARLEHRRRAPMEDPDVIMERIMADAEAAGRRAVAAARGETPVSSEFQIPEKPAISPAPVVVEMPSEMAFQLGEEAAPTRAENAQVGVVLRAVEPIQLHAADAPPVPETGEPIFESVDPRTLLVDETYQRGLTEKSLTLIRKIATEWDWRRFKPPVVAMVDGGLQIIDGQHTAIAAASRPDLTAIPVMIVEAVELTDRARAFIGINKDRLATTAMQMHHAAVAAGDEDALTIEQVCARAGVRLVRSAHGAYRWKVGDTVALGAIKGLIDRRGAMKARQMLEALVAAGSAPVTVHEIKAAEMLFTDSDYADQIEPLTEGGAEDLATAIKALGDTAAREAKVFAGAHCVPHWKALGIIWFRKTKKRRKAA